MPLSPETHHPTSLHAKAAVSIDNASLALLHKKLDFIIEFLAHASPTSHSSSTQTSMPTPHANEGTSSVRQACLVPPATHHPSTTTDLDSFFERLESEIMDMPILSTSASSLPETPMTSRPISMTPLPPSSTSLLPPSPCQADLAELAPRISSLAAPTTRNTTVPIGSSNPPKIDITNMKSEMTMQIKALQRSCPEFNDWWHMTATLRFNTRDPKRTPTTFLAQTLSEWT